MSEYLNDAICARCKFSVIPWDKLFCDRCMDAIVAAGLLAKPKPVAAATAPTTPTADHLTQIGPTDI